MTIIRCKCAKCDCTAFSYHAVFYRLFSLLHMSNRTACSAVILVFWPQKFAEKSACYLAMLRDREHNLLTPSKPRTRNGKDRRRCKTDLVLKRSNCLNTLSCTVYFYEHHLAHIWTKISNTSCTPAYADSHSSNEASQSSLEKRRERQQTVEK